MSEGELHAAIEAALHAVPFAPPLTVAYCHAVKTDLAARVPGGVTEVYFTPSVFRVEARLGAARARYELSLRPPT